MSGARDKTHFSSHTRPVKAESNLGVNSRNMMANIPTKYDTTKLRNVLIGVDDRYVGAYAGKLES